MRTVPGILVGILSLGILMGGCGGKSSSQGKSKSKSSQSSSSSSKQSSTSSSGKSGSSKSQHTSQKKQSQGTKSQGKQQSQTAKPPTPPTTTGTTTQTGNPTGTNAHAAALYTQKCQVCHGPGGAGASAPKLDAGMRARFKTQAQLQSFIEKNMPFNSPGSLSGAQASALARYIWSMQKP